METNRLSIQVLQYKYMWLQHVKRKDTNRLTNQAIQCKNAAKTCKDDGHKQTTKTSTTI